MSGMLIIETATDACSLALCTPSGTTERHILMPRQHSQQVFILLDELLGEGETAVKEIDCVAYGCGPGSFTGLRIAASIAQGLCYALDVPAVSVSTLAAIAQTALHQDIASSDDRVLVTVDARINEIYGAVFSYRDGIAQMCDGPWVCSPEHITCSRQGAFIGVGTGFRYLEQFPQQLRERISHCHADVYPQAAHMLPLVQDAISRGQTHSASEVLPAYVQEEVSWKKLHEQGVRS